MPVDKCRLPAQPKASLTVSKYGLTRESGIPSFFPKHLTERSVTWQKGWSDPRRVATHTEPSGSSLML